MLYPSSLYISEIIRLLRDALNPSIHHSYLPGLKEVLFSDVKNSFLGDYVFCFFF